MFVCFMSPKSKKDSPVQNKKRRDSNESSEDDSVGMNSSWEENFDDESPMIRNKQDIVKANAQSFGWASEDLDKFLAGKRTIRVSKITYRSSGEECYSNESPETFKYKSDCKCI
eukprot:TRINITY_DN777_c0_g6_i1.p1 TRINITY_DN777_c0_g6~~TRINITY_DN777_c0_g6_i1.p1  ORF type:complete len:114 (-),score=23.58 TRINITY_DN777_c0_g6_i1:124-465(-)